MRGRAKGIDGVSTPTEREKHADCVAEAVVSLWEAASGGAVEEWSLPAQERAWGFFVGWARRLGEGVPGTVRERGAQR